MSDDRTNDEADDNLDDAAPTDGRTDCLRLGDGRRLAYRDHGRAGTPTVFFFHGSGSSADGLDLATRVIERGGRLISPARPGIGASDPHPDRTLSGWAADVAQLADHLDIPTFSMLGFSGGAPHALAAAAGLPQRVTRVAVLSCGGPFDCDGATDGMSGPNRLIWLLVRRAPRLVRFLFQLQARQLARDPHAPTAAALRTLGGPDRNAISGLTVEEQHRFFDEPMSEALAQGPGGLVRDMELLQRPWDFDPADITSPVGLWHGRLDTSAPVAMARHLARTIPTCEATLLEEEGHLSTILASIDDAVDHCLAG